MSFKILKSQTLIFLIVVLSSFNTLTIYGQDLKRMTPDVYSQWNKIVQIKLSDSAQITTYILEKEVGNRKLAVYKKSDGSTIFFDRVGNYHTDPSGKFVVFTKTLDYDSLRSLKRKKTAKDKLPKDSLVIFDVTSNQSTVISSIEDFKCPEKYSGFVFYTKKMENTNTLPAKKDTIKQDSTMFGASKKKNPCETKYLVIRDLYKNLEDTIFQVGDYTFAHEYPILSYTQCTGDSLAKYSVKLKDLTNDSLNILMVTDTGYFQVTQMNFSKDGKCFSYLSLDKKYHQKLKPFHLHFRNVADSTTLNLDEKIANIKPKSWEVNGDQIITWSDSGKRLFFGLSPALPEKDTMLLDDEIVNVEIWHHDAPRLYTMMESTKDADAKKAYNTYYDVDSMSMAMIENLDLDQSITSVKGDGRYVLQLRSKPYQKEITWLGESRKDFVLFDTKDHTSKLILTGEFGSPNFSPGGRFIYWWSRSDSIWKTFDTEKSILGVLGLWSFSKFHNEENDIPQRPGPYGIAGWMPGDTSAILYDRYDLWKADPLNPFNIKQLTSGRPSKKIHRRIDLDPDQPFIDPSEKMFLRIIDETTKSTAYATLNLDSLHVKTLINGDFLLTSQIKKANKSEDIIFTKESFKIFPDIILSDLNFDTLIQVSKANSQQAEYGWGNGQLFSWTNYRNVRNEGMLFFPPNFDPEKKYPLIVNFYEKSSDDLHRHRAPEAHRSTINYSYYTNHGYVIFNPDISYLTGQPGEDCLNAVESGVDALLKTGYIDESRMALQGHSWGGYQVAYLLTKSERYKCAESGAPVVNMVSAYGGIRWESGMSRMFQYEKTQSRLGTTLWENASLFHKNSPLYEMTNVTTPVLILHNDADGAVPWYQGIEYFMALRRLGKPAWLLNYNDEPHWPVKWQNRLDFNIRMEQFFNHFLMDAEMPLWMKEGNTPLEKGILQKY